MVTRRVGSLLKRIWSAKAPFSGASSTQVAIQGALQHATAGSCAQDSTVTPGTRAYSSWEAYWSTPRRNAMHREVHVARSMLPHRTNFVAQFTPHGFQLIPESLLSPLLQTPYGDPDPDDASEPRDGQQQQASVAGAGTSKAAKLQQRRRQAKTLASGQSEAAATSALAPGRAAARRPKPKRADERPRRVKAPKQ